MDSFVQSIKDLCATSGLANMTLPSLIMILISFVFLYLAIKHKFEPLLLLPIAFGMLLTNLPLTGMYHPELFDISGGKELDFGAILEDFLICCIWALSCKFILLLSSSVSDV